MDEYFIKWFKKEIPELLEKNVISAEAAESLTSYYEKKLSFIENPANTPVYTEETITEQQKSIETEAPIETAPQEKVSITEPESNYNLSEQETIKPVERKKKSKVSVSVILSVIAGVLISFGIISLIAYNWAAIPRIAKAVSAILLLVATQTGGFILIKTGRAESVKIRESYSLFWALLFGGIVAFVSQIFKFQISSTTFMLLWTVSAILITYLFSAYTTFFLSMLFSLIFICFGWKTNSFAFAYPLFAATYFAARKNQVKYIPLYIYGIVIFLLRILLINIPDNIRVMLIVSAFSSAAFFFFQKERRFEIGAVLLPLAALVSLTNIIPRFYISLPLNVTEIVMIGIIILGFFTEGVIIPLFKKFKSNEKFSLDNLIYLSPIILCLNSLFFKNSEILLKTNALKSYLIFTSPLTLVLIFISALFIISFFKNQNRTWAFLSCIILIFIKSFVCAHAPSIMYLTSEIFVLLLALTLYKQTFISKSENIYIIPIARAVTGILFFITLLSGFFGNYGFTKESKIPYNIVLCFIPQVIFSFALFGKYIKNNSKKFLSILDIPVILLFTIILIAVSNSKNIDVLKLAVKIISFLLFIYSLIISIKFGNYSFLIYSGITGIYLLLELVVHSDIFTIFYFVCMLLFFITGLFLWKNKFELNSDNKNFLIIIRIVAVIIYFITNIMANISASILYDNSGIDKFTFFTFTPLAISGLALFGIFSAKNVKAFLLNVDIIITLAIPSVLFCIADLFYQSNILFILGFFTALTLIMSCIYIIRLKKYEYIFYVLFSILYFIYSFFSKDYFSTILFMLSTSALFIPGLFLWKEKFMLGEDSKTVFIISRMLSLALLFTVTIMVNNSYAIEYLINSKIANYIIATFAPAAIFGIVNFAIFAKKDFKNFISNLDIVINLFLTTVILLITSKGTESVLKVTSETLIILNMLAACIFLIVCNKKSYIANLIFSTLYYVISHSNSGYSEILFILCTAALFISGLFLWKERFTLGEGSKTVFIISRMLSLALLFTVTIMVNNSYAIEYLINSKIANYIIATFAPAAIFGIVNFAIFAKKDFKNFITNLDFVINLFLTTVILLIVSKGTESVLKVTSETLIILNMLAACIFLIVCNKKSYIANLIFSTLYYVISHSNSGYSEILFILCTAALFISGLFLWKEKFKLGEGSKTVFIISRILSLALLFTVTIMVNNSYAIEYLINSKIANYIIATFAPAAIFGIVNFAIFAKKDFKNFISNLDIVINLFLISVILLIVSKGTESVLSITSETLIILNMLAACIFLFVFHKKSYIANLIIATVYYIISLSNASYSDNISVSIWFFVTLVIILIHFYAQTKDIKVLKVFSTLIPGFMIFYFTALRTNFDSPYRPMYLNYYILAYMIISGATAVYLLVQLIREKILFNPAIFAFPPAVLLLSKISDKASIVITFPLLLIFCVYYFYLAYKNDSLKTANLSTIYFGLILMIRFFTSGYGLAVQGITLILMGILLIIMNIMMTKRRARND